MKKINTNNKLKIKNNQTKLIKEERIDDKFSDFIDAIGTEEISKIITNLGMSSLAIGKLGASLTVNPLAKIFVDKFWHGEEKSWEDVIADYKKSASGGFAQFKKDVDKVTQDHENNVKGMLGDIGMSEKEFNTMFAAGSPALGLINKIYDISKNNYGDSRSTTNWTTIEDVFSKISSVLKDYTKGSSITNLEVENNLKKEFGKGTIKVLKNLHQERYFERHFNYLEKACEDVSKRLDLSNKNDVECIALAKINNSDFNNLITKVKKYCDANQNAKVTESFYKKLNLDSMLITEEFSTKNKNDYRKFVLSLTSLYINKNKNKIKTAIITSQTGLDNDDLTNLVSILETKTNIMQFFCGCYMTALTDKFLLDLTKKVKEDLNFDIKNNLENLIKDKVNNKINSLDNFYKSILETGFKNYYKNLEDAFEKTSSNDECVANLIKLCKDISKKNKIEKGAAKFDWINNGDSQIFKDMNNLSLLTDGEINFIKNVNLQDLKIDDINKEIEKTANEIEEEVKKASSGSSSGSTP